MVDAIREGLTYEDVLLVPKYSEINSRKSVDISTKLTKKISLKIPFVSGNMDTVTESKMAIAIARLGGIGIIHRYMPIQDQVNEILKVKRAEAVVIENPYTLTPEHILKDAKKLMEEKNINGIPITDNVGRYVGILTSKDLLFEDNMLRPISEVMTSKDDSVSAPANTDIDTAKKILQANKVEKLPLVDKNGMLKGLITAKDLLRKEQYPDASKDKKGRLLVGAAIGVTGDYLERAEALLNAGANVLLIDIAHGHSKLAIDATKAIKDKFGDVDLIVGNVATAEAALDLINAGADCIKIGIGSGSICITRLVAGAGVPQLTALMDCAKVARECGIPVMSDGGTGGMAGNIVKAIAAGASTVMRNRSLAGTDESPGITVMRNGRKFKIYRGSASFGANMTRNLRMGQNIDEDYNPEGVEALIPHSGTVAEVIKPSIDGLRSGMSYSGAKNIEEFWNKAEFIKITSAAWKESLPHDVDLVK